jgi:hypothetical protein
MLRTHRNAFLENLKHFSSPVLVAPNRFQQLCVFFHEVHLTAYCILGLPPTVYLQKTQQVYIHVRVCIYVIT